MYIMGYLCSANPPESPRWDLNLSSVTAEPTSQPSSRLSVLSILSSSSQKRDSQSLV